MANACTGQESKSPTSVDISATGILNLTNLNAYREEMDDVISYIEESNNTSYADPNQLRRYGYLVDLVNGGEFKFYVPEYDVSTTANWDSVNILGRSVEVKAYSGTNSIQISVKLELMAGDGLYKFDTNDKNPADVLQSDVNFVRSLEYPDYSKSIILPPPSTLLYLGPNLKLRGIITQVSAEFMKPFTIDLKPMRVDLSFTFVHITENPPDIHDIRKGEFEGPYGSSFITSTESSNSSSQFVNEDVNSLEEIYASGPDSTLSHKSAEEILVSIASMYSEVENYTTVDEFHELLDRVISPMAISYIEEYIRRKFPSSVDDSTR